MRCGMGGCRRRVLPWETHKYSGHVCLSSTYDIECPYHVSSADVNLVGAGSVESVALSTDGLTCVSGSYDKTIRCACHGQEEAGVQARLCVFTPVLSDCSASVAQLPSSWVASEAGWLQKQEQRL